MSDLLHALGKADPVAASVWTDALAYLRGPTRVAILGLDAGVVQRAARRAAEAQPTMDFVSVVLPPEEQIVADPRWLRCHAMVWVTGPPSPLGAQDRAAMAAVAAQGAPAEHAVWLVDLDLLARISDAPEAEAATVRARVAAATDWPVIEDIGPWLIERSTPDRRAREQQVAAFLCSQAARRARAEAEAETDAADAIDRLLAESDAKVAVAVERARRDAARVLGAARRHAEAVRTDWDAFVGRFVESLPVEFAAVDDAVLDDALGPWLEHVVQGWLRDRLARYRGELLVDLAETSDADATACAAIAVPAVHAGVRAERDWARRIGVTAALGGGFALLFSPAWPLGLAALGGTWWWSQAATKVDRAGRMDQTVRALHRLRTDVAARIVEQVDAVGQALDALAERQAAAAHDGVAVTRAGLVAESADSRSRAARAHARADEVASAAL